MTRDTHFFRNALTMGAIVSFAMSLGFSTARAAGSASVSFSPQSGSESVGKTFTVNVMVASGGGVGVNAADGEIGFDPTLLAVQSVSKENSVFDLWTANPSFSNTAGTVNYSGGSTSAYAGDSGMIISVTFKVLKAGSANLKFVSASVLAADGQGTNVLGGTGTGSFILGGAAPSAPAASQPAETPAASTESTAAQAAPSSFTVSFAVTSPTHPDPTQWYADANPNFVWQLTADVAGVSTAFDRTPNTTPRRSSEGLLQSKQYSNIAEGVWYFHARFEDAFGDWSDTVSLPARIDVTPPLPFTVTAAPGAGAEGKTLLSFNATDTVSGIDHYSVTFDGASSTTVQQSDLQNGTYTAGPLLPGAHTVVVGAVDKAGNTTDESAQFTIAGISAPKVTSFPTAVVERTPIVLDGIADSGANVTVDLTDPNGKVVAEGKVVADETGHWLYAVENGVSSGKYAIGVSMVTAQGAQSSSTDKLLLQVMGAPFIASFGWILVGALILLIALMIAYEFYRKKMLEMKLLLMKRENTEVRDTTKAVFEALREEVDEKVNTMQGGALQAQGETPLEPEHVLDALRDALAVSENAIEKEIDDVDKTLNEK
jgi:hypothetical protein